MNKKKLPHGRPSKYKPEYCKQVIEHLKKGFSYEIFAAIIKVNVDTLYEWEKVHPSYSDAKREGLLLSQQFYEALIIKALVKNERFNTAAWIFLMKNRFKWVDRQPEEIDGNKYEPIIIELPDVGKTLSIENKKDKP